MVFADPFGRRGQDIRTVLLSVFLNYIFLDIQCRFNVCIASHLYALRVLRCHGIPDRSLKDVFQATVLAKITYCLPAWSGLCTAADRTRLLSETVREAWVLFLQRSTDYHPLPTT